MEKIILLISCWCVMRYDSHAQQYSIDWYKIAGGGGTSIGGHWGEHHYIIFGHEL